VNAEEEEEKRRLIRQVLELQNTLDGKDFIEFYVIYVCFSLLIDACVIYRICGKLKQFLKKRGYGVKYAVLYIESSFCYLKKTV